MKRRTFLKGLGTIAASFTIGKMPVSPFDINELDKIEWAESPSIVRYGSNDTLWVTDINTDVLYNISLDGTLIESSF
jgi:hypothetical protein